jgi:hypothetical protein
VSGLRGVEEIMLSGPPHKTAAFVRLDPPESAVVPITMDLAGTRGVYRAYVTPFGHGTSEVRLELPRATPPGTYRGQASLGGKRLGVLVDVEAVVRIGVQPKRTALAGEPGSRQEFRISVANGGNVPFDVPKAGSFDLDDAEGYGRALGRSLRSTLAQGEHRVDRLFEEIRTGHGGEARVTVVTGAGPLEPGESRALACLLDVPSALRVGHSYRGSWGLGNARQPVLIEVRKGADPGKPRTTA